MTLKELSIELGKPAHVLANTLRQVGLTNILLSEQAELNPAQVRRLRYGKTGPKPNNNTIESVDDRELQELNEYIDELEHPEMNIDSEDSDYMSDDAEDVAEADSSATGYTVFELAAELNIAEERVINILRHVVGIRGELDYDTPISDTTADLIVRYYEAQNKNNHAQSFVNIYLKDKENVWDNPVVEQKRSDGYAPGEIIEGSVYDIDHSQKLIKVHFTKLTHEEWGFWSNQIIVDRLPRNGTVSFDEWDWELEKNYTNLPETGSCHSFLILQNNDGEDLTLSKRQTCKSPMPREDTGFVVRHHIDEQLVCVRLSNGAYGFISYKDLSPYDVEDGDTVLLKPVKKFKKIFGNKTFMFAQYRISDEDLSKKIDNFNTQMLGLDIARCNDAYLASNVMSWDDFVNHYNYGNLIVGQITETNNGGFIMETVGKKSYELFCPFSKSPTWIDRTAMASMIGSKWLVSIETAPEESDINTVVSAKLDPEDYDGILISGGFYRATVCSCNDSGANLLVLNCVPVFVNNKNIGWKKNNNANTDLKPGDTVIVKILKDSKGITASIRDASIDPWLRVSKAYPVGSIVGGTAPTYIDKDFIRVDLGEYTGHLHASEISWTEPNIPDCREVALPAPLSVVVTGYHEKSRTVQVSLRKLTPDPWPDIEEYLPADLIVSAAVTELTNRGAWLKVGDIGFKGYLSYRDVDWCRYVDRSSFPYSPGDRIKVKVTHRNKDRRQLTCSLKALIPNPWEELSEKETVEGTVINVYDDYAVVRIAGGIERECREALDPSLEGQVLKFDILQINAAAQHLVISYRKQEIEQLNTLAVGDMFKKYRHLTDADKELFAETDDEEGTEVYRNFTIKAVSSTGRVTAIYAENDGEYENGILLPGSITLKGHPVNVIFARQIIKQHIVPGETLVFRITHRYGGFNYAVLALDAADLLDLDHIATNDMASLTSVKGVEATVLSDICTVRNLFVRWKGYFGYLPRTESADFDNQMPDTIRVRAAVGPEHPGQMIRFTTVDREEEEEERLEQQAEKDIVDRLDPDLRDCYDLVNGLNGFNPNLPDYYPFVLQIRYDVEQHEEFAEFLASERAGFSSQSFFLDCFKIKDGKGYVLKVFNNNISISAFCSEREDGDEILVTKFTPDVSASMDRVAGYGRPLRIAGENIDIQPLNSSALPPAMQDMDILIELLRYNREVLPELRKLTRDGMQKRGEHYLTLKELLKMDLKREETLCKKEIMINGTPVSEADGSLGGIGIEFEADENAFDRITSKDDGDEGIRVMIKYNDGEPFIDKVPGGILKYLGSRRWKVELYPDRDFDVDVMNRCGLKIKRYSNTKHLDRQIKAIDNFVYERFGLDIFSKIARNKLKPVEFPPAESIDANPNFRMQDPADSQANALKMALGDSQITLIQGPPGTGKSTVIVDIIRNLVKRHKKVLVCTQSVAPVEELYFKLSGRRECKNMGDPVKVNEHPLRCAYLHDDEFIKISGSVEERRNALKDMMLLVQKLKDADNSATDAMREFKDFFKTAHQDLKKECDEVSRKFYKEILPKYEDVQNILSEYHRALDKEDVENYTSKRRTLNLESVDVVFGTCIGVGVSPLLRDLHFDTLIIDEAGKANYAESLVPMMMADEYILVGDDKQLPPYTNSELVRELAEYRLEKAKSESGQADGMHVSIDSLIEEIIGDVGNSLFRDLKPRLPESNRTMLSRQFRMHPEIGDFVSKLFYDGKVDSVPKPEDRTLTIPGLEHAITFIDTSGMGYEARESRRGMSLYNDGEIQVIKEKLLPMLEAAIDSGRSVGILSPYGAQVEKLREKLPRRFRKHIFTIDSIQGEEYDIVVFSFVRNTRSGSLNFVDDLRRLNVSFSRAKCNLIMVGHLDTLRNESLHKVDKEAVMAVYNEIINKKIELVVHHGAMQRLYEDFPPGSSPLIENLDEPYHVFEDCRPAKGGQFTGFYKGKLLTLYNPVLKDLPKDAQPESFRASLIGYVDNKPHTMIEPIGLWLTQQNTLRDYRFRATVNESEQSSLTLELADKSFISLSIPNPHRFPRGMKVEVEVRGNRKFTVKPVDND